MHLLLFNPVKDLITDNPDADSTWDLTAMFEPMAPFLGVATTLMGGAIMIFAGVLLIKKLMNDQRNQDSWAKIIMLIIIGGMVSLIPMLILNPGDAEKKKINETQPTATPPPATHTPAPTPDPIVLPEIHNLSFLWIIPVVLITITLLYLLVRRVNSDRLTGAVAKAELAEQKALRAKIAENITRRWEAVITRHQRLTRRYLESETDWDMLFSYPALQDVSVPETSAMIHAMLTANDSDPSQPDSLTEVSDLSDYSYVRAVNNFDTAWQRALENATKIGQSGIPRQERKTIKQIRTLLNLAENAGATPAERELAYSRAQLLIKTLTSITVPAKVMAAIESSQRLAIEAGPTASSDSAIAL